MNALTFSLLVMVGWALFVIVLSRWKYGLALLAGLGCYVGALLLARELGFGAVAAAWAMMAAIGAIGTALTERTPVSGTIATFVVGLIAWPLVFPGIRTPKRAPAAAPTEAVAVAIDDDGDDDESAVAQPSAESVLCNRTGVPETAVEFAAPLSIVLGDGNTSALRGFTLARATEASTAYVRTTAGEETTFDERAGTRLRLSISADADGNFVVLGRNDAVVQQLVRTRLPETSRDDLYALAAAFGRVYEGAVVVEDALGGLDV